MQQILFQEPKAIATLAGRTPRPYQTKAVQTALEQLDSGARGTLLRSPTGTGKSFMLAMMADEWLKRSDQHRVIIGLHEITLIHQLAEDLRKTLGIAVGVEQAENKINMNSPNHPRVIIFSRQTLDEKEVDGEKASRLYKFPHSDYKWLLVADECHRWRWGMPSCKHIIKWFDESPHNKRFGLTATPKRSDKATFTKLFPEVCLDYRFVNAVEDGWIVPFRQKWLHAAHIELDTSEVPSQIKMDKKFDEILQDAEHLIPIAEKAIEVCEGQTIAYCPDVKSAYAVAAQINASIGWNAAKALDGSVKKETRQYIFEQHKKGEFRFLVVCGLCIAKGTLVLTDKGEVPIEDVTLDMKVWDGVEFVSHGGVISKGVRPVIEYSGLTATEDHNVWTASGWKSLADCKKHGTPIKVSAIGGRPVREVEGYYRGGNSNRESESSGLRGQVRRLREADDESIVGTQSGPGGVQELFKEVRNTSVAPVSLSCSLSEMHEPELSRLSRLRREGDQDELRIINRNGSLGDGEPGIAQGNVPGPDRQQRPLRTGEHSVCNGRPTGEQQACEAMVEETEVFDILNAGPRHRFTANGLLVSNCREGYDDPNVSNILCLRPIRKESSHLAEQMKGRGVRPHSSIAHRLGELETAEDRRELIANSPKPHCNIIDMAGITGLPEVPSTVEILAEGLPDDIVQRAKKKAEKDGVDPIKAIQEATEEIKSEKEEQARIEAERRKAIRARVEWIEREVRSGGGGSYQNVARDPNRPRGTASDKQVDYLVKLGIPRETAEMWSKQQAGAVITQRRNLSGAKYRVTFGKHAGKALCELPPGYLQWIVDQNETSGQFAELIPHIEQMDNERSFDFHEAKT